MLPIRAALVLGQTVQGLGADSRRMSLRAVRLRKGYISEVGSELTRNGPPQLTAEFRVGLEGYEPKCSEKTADVH